MLRGVADQTEKSSQAEHHTGDGYPAKAAGFNRQTGVGGVDEAQAQALAHRVEAEAWPGTVSVEATAVVSHRDDQHHIVDRCRYRHGASLLARRDAVGDAVLDQRLDDHWWTQCGHDPRPGYDGRGG